MPRSRFRGVILLTVALTLSASCVFAEEPVSEIDLPVEGELVVVRDTDDNDRGELFIINADGSNVRRIMDDQGYGLPVWSPDGRQIAALGNTSEGHPIVIIDVETETSTPVEVPTGSYEGPAWFPDGRGIVFSGIDHGRDPVYPPGSSVGFLGSQIYAADTETLEARRLTEADAVNYVGAGWSPDRARIAYSDSAGLWIANANGSNPVHASGDLRVAQSPVWSPDGGRIAFNGYSDAYSGIYVVDADGSNLQRVVPEGFVSSSPAWSPDGASLAITHFSGGITELHVLDLATGDMRRLARVDGGIQSTWSPDGQWISFVTQFRDGESLGPTHLSIVNAHDPDAEAETIVRDLMNVSVPEWRPSTD